ncbi:MFS transporter [Halarcobacter anaerophilus]|jgi:predicted MFS family arabinose efflux permease|uniref:MFS transporter n=1 Tax=Halarcobacter anaerophilus TaxID=877500 RepID=A0A4Q0XYC7_9BACT|nr:MFS transporter [Halarcobacter anaerophilus]QDF29657.1 major facilitator superfamily transporter [Halarcobacter anaerophilus]RXJ62582.1 MFS transporter [Halarcobacter anaerophilus]
MNNTRRSQKITIFATFLAFMGMGVVDPILPDIAKNLGANNWEVELLFSTYIFMMALIMIPAGILATRIGDKNVMTIGLLIVSFFAIACSFSENITILAFFRAGWGFGNAYFFATALILLILLSKNHYKAISLFEGAIGFGMASGPLLGGFIGQYSWRYPFLVTGILTGIAFILVVAFVKIPPEKNKKKSGGFKELKDLFKNKKFLKISFAAMFYYYGFFVILAYSPLILHFTPIQIGLVFFAWGLALAIGSIIISTYLEVHFSIKKVIPITLIFFIILLLFFYEITSQFLLSILIICSGFLSGINNSLFTSYVMDIKFERNIISGGYNLLRWSGAAIAPITSGFISEYFTLKTPFVIAVILSLLSLTIILLLSKKTIYTHN